MATVLLSMVCYRIRYALRLAYCRMDGKKTGQDTELYLDFALIAIIVSVILPDLICFVCLG